MRIQATPVAIGDVRWRQFTTVEGAVRSLRARPWADTVASLECTIVDDTGGIELVFLGRRSVAGIHLGSEIRVSGRVGVHHARLAMLNPVYELMVAPNS